ncbi:hypothetical protein KY360_02750 [Candidatus Woesearchaeota archaeon]|nr:hypothetical protein [Candidatus Woesearchaeota archaeon]
MSWKLITLKQYPMFSRWWIHEAFLHDMKDTLGMNFKMYKSLYSGTYADSDEVEKLRSMLISKLEKDIDSIRKLCENWKHDCDELIRFTKELEKSDFSKNSDEELVNLSENCIKKLRRSASYIYLSVVLDEYFQNWLNKILEAKVQDQNERTKYFQILTSPTKNTKLIDAKKVLIEISKVVKEKGLEGAEDLIKDYVSKFKWLGYDTGIGSDLTIEQTKDKISNILEQKQHDSDVKNRDEVLSELDLNEKDKELLDLMDELIFLRTYRAESNMVAGADIRPILEELAKRANTNYDNLVQLTIDEIKDSIKSKKVDLKKIEERKNKYGLLMVDGKNTIYSGDEVDKVEEKVEVPEGLTELKGLVAHHGNKRGHVKIVLRHKDFDKIEFGDILVTKMTNPDFIVVLEQCSGIITDIGGITSHAAIVARELNKPCITGTQYATKVLKDGDLVELDTDKGIVKIIK